MHFYLFSLFAQSLILEWISCVAITATICHSYLKWLIVRRISLRDGGLVILTGKHYCYYNVQSKQIIHTAIVIMTQENEPERY